jgi:flagellin
MGVAEKALEGQMEFIDSLTDTLDSGVSSMVDADMEQEAARLQALQVQQQLATQSLSIANRAPQNVLSLFR